MVWLPLTLGILFAIQMSTSAVAQICRVDNWSLATGIDNVYFSARREWCTEYSSSYFYF